MALCAVSPFRYSVIVFRLLCIIWYRYELLAESFIVSARTVVSGFSIPCLRAFTADWTKLYKYLNGVYWTNWWVWVHSSPRIIWKLKSSLIFVLFVTWKLDINIFWGCNNSLFSSACSFLKAPMFDWETNVLLKTGENVSRLSGTFISHWTSPNKYPLHMRERKILKVRSRLKKKLIEQKSWSHGFVGDFVSIHFPTSLR